MLGVASFERIGIIVVVIGARVDMLMRMGMMVRHGDEQMQQVKRERCADSGKQV